VGDGLHAVERAGHGELYGHAGGGLRLVEDGLQVGQLAAGQYPQGTRAAQVGTFRGGRLGLVTGTRRQQQRRRGECQDDPVAHWPPLPCWPSLAGFIGWLHRPRCWLHWPRRWATARSNSSSASNVGGSMTSSSVVGRPAPPAETPGANTDGSLVRNPWRAAS